MIGRQSVALVTSATDWAAHAGLTLCRQSERSGRIWPIRDRRIESSPIQSNPIRSNPIQTNQCGSLTANEPERGPGGRSFKRHATGFDICRAANWRATAS